MLPFGHLLPFGKQAELRLITAKPAIHTTSLNTTSFLYDLVARPEYFETLWRKADTVWAKAEDPDRMRMAELIGLDGFLEESQRLNPRSELTFNREIRAKEGLLSQTAYTSDKAPVLLWLQIRWHLI